MNKYQYKWEHIRASELVSTLNNFGKEGWRVVSVDWDSENAMVHILLELVGQ